MTQGLPVITPQHMLPVKVSRRIVLTSDTVSLSLVLPGTSQAPAPYLPGQFITLALPTPKETLYRSYSLCGDGDPGQPWEITVKRMHMGAVSTYFYQSVQENTLLYASLPRGNFTLPADLSPQTRLVLIAAGSGITPNFGMLRAIAKMHPDDRPLVQLHYASRSEDETIFGPELRQMDPHETWLRQYHYLSSEGNRMTIPDILQSVGRQVHWAHWYFCGPEVLKQELIAELADLGVPDTFVHSEVFGAKNVPHERPAYRVTGNLQPMGGSIQVRETGAKLDVEPGETLLVALERHGYHPDFSCRAGACGACKLRLIDGEVDVKGEALSPADRNAGFVLSCIAHPMGEVTLANGGRRPAGVAAVAGGSDTGSTSPDSSKVLVRIGALAAVGTLMFGVWNMTDQLPQSWKVVRADSSSNVTTSSGSTTTTTGTGTGSTGTTGSGSTPVTSATPQGSGGGTNHAPPTATPTKGNTPTSGGGGKSPAPTAVAAATATPTPKPTAAPPPPKATSTPS